jgi:transposase
MSTTKTKKRKKRKIEKKKNLPLINKQFIKDNQCWLPTREYSEDYDCMDMPSWFSIKSTHVDAETPAVHKLVYVSKNKEPPEIRVKRIELYPNKIQKDKLLQWMELYRRYYNLTVSNRSKFINKNNIQSEYKVRDRMRDEILPANIKLAEEIKSSGILASTIRNAPCDMHKAFISASGNKTAGNIKSFRIRHKKKSSHLRMLVLEKEAFSTNGKTFAKTALGNEIKSSEPFSNITKECRLTYNFRTDKFVLWVPYIYYQCNFYTRNSLISLDPGMRTFQTGYSPDGICYSFVPTKTNPKTFKEENKLKILLKRVDNVVKKKNHKKFLARIREKITNMVTDMHWKTALFLCTRFDKILVGNMSTTGIVKKESSFMTADMKKYCIALSHYKFRERLLSKAAEYGVDCKIVDESYTTKTCGVCGKLNENVKGKEVFKCISKRCGLVIDRDYNGGRNIYLKTMSKL